MKYIRTENGIEKLDADREYLAEYMNGKQADTIEDLMQVGDIVFYWYSNDDTEHCENIIRDWDIHRFKYTTLTRLLIPVNENDYKCVAKAESSFELISGRRYLVQKGVLKLL